ncbi:DUF4386 domain-containing protein [Winogradskyella sp.]|uniref:DUF4386 domain-containing protein n=1 Tax=Winogradskyella sp. TaxID=1883156 RepID=UPI0035155649
MKTVAKVSGIAYVLIFLTGFYANFAILSNLVEIDNPSKTLSNISNSLNSFRNGLLSFLLMFVFDIVLIVTLFKLTKEVNRKLSFLASGFRMLHAIFFSIALLKLYDVFTITNGTNLSVKQPNIVLDLLSSFDKFWTIGLLFFGVHLLILGYLATKAHYIPRYIGFLLIQAALGYFIDGFAKLSYDGYYDYQPYFEAGVILTGVIGELSFTIWLLVTGFFRTKLKLE